MMTRSMGLYCALAMFGVVGGCWRGEISLSEKEARERASRNYATAMDNLQAGRVDQAVAEFEQVLRDDPKLHSAHFQLATLLQDAKKDYIGAIAHYREYRALRPNADKVQMAKDREALCERQLASLLVRKAGLANAEEQLRKENELLAEDLRKAKAENAALGEKLEESRKTSKRLGEELATMRRMVNSIGGEAESGASAMKKPVVDPSDAALLEDDDEEATKPRDRIAMSDDVKALRLEGDEDERKGGMPKLADNPDLVDDLGDATARPFSDTGTKVGAKGGADKPKDSANRALDNLFSGSSGAKPKENSRPSTYTIQPGDTLFRVSERFYGSSSSWRKIREANKAIIPPDGRLQAGKVIVLP